MLSPLSQLAFRAENPYFASYVTFSGIYCFMASSRICLPSRFFENFFLLLPLIFYLIVIISSRLFSFRRTGQCIGKSIKSLSERVTVLLWSAQYLVYLPELAYHLKTSSLQSITTDWYNLGVSRSALYCRKWTGAAQEWVWQLIIQPLHLNGCWNTIAGYALGIKKLYCLKEGRMMGNAVPD